MVSRTRLILKFIFIYTVITSILISFFIYEDNKNVKKYLDEKTADHLLEYKAIFDEYKIIANLIFDTDININEIKDIFKYAHKSNDLEKNILREKLLHILENKYSKLKKYNLRQLHFHLPNNDSFLRMHRPKKFGDNLSDVRATVAFVNKHKKYVDGFEEGRIFNGFRFVFPLFDEENNHLGSVEISFSALALINTIDSTYNLKANFIVKKDVVDSKVFKEEQKNYIKSPHKDFYFEKAVYEKHKGVLMTLKGQDLTDKILKGDAFSFYLEKSNYIKTLIPVKNPISKKVVAALCICEEDMYIKTNKRNLLLLITFTMITMGIIIFLFFKQKLSNQKLAILNNHLDRKVRVEIQKNRQKDLQILNQAKMASIGEILNSIAHQWRQPLNAISTSASGLLLHKEIDTLDDENFTMLTNSIIDQTQYLSKTITHFSDFIDEGNENSTFALQERVEKVLSIVKSDFKHNYIEIKKSFDEDNIYVSGMASELSQVILNILNNAKDVLIENKDISNRKIDIKVHEKDKMTALITIEDNAGGIPYNIIDKIFNPYFTTKHESVGTGIGLYMCYELIVKNFKGNIYAKNSKKGAKFFIELPIKV